MALILHIITQPSDSLAEKVMEEQRRLPDCAVRVIDLTAPSADYRELLREIFDADSVEVW